MSKKLLIMLFTFLILILVLAFTFLPAFFPKQSLKGLYIAPGTSNNDLPKVRDWWNPINPTFVTVNDLDTPQGLKHTIYLYKSTRNSLFTFFINANPNSTSNDVKTIIVQPNDKYNTKEKILNAATKYDLTKESPDTTIIMPTNSNNSSSGVVNTQEYFSQKQALLDKEKDLPLECNLKEANRFSQDTTMSKFKLDKVTNLSGSFDQVINNFSSNDTRTVNAIISQDTNDVENIMIKIQDPTYPRIKLVQLYFGDMKPKEQIKPEDKLAKVFVVLQDCTRIEVPSKADGTFDFESGKNKFE